jgi:uncharacterized protein DUF547
MNSTDHFSYDEYDRLTRAYANEQGGVNYAGLKKEIAALKDFIEQLGAASPENKPEWFPNENERKRYYLTAYNAYILFYAASAYPDRHALWSRLGLFKNKDIVLGGRKLTLNDLEHNIIRKEFMDPRIHFALNCGARSCPPLKAGVIAQNATDNELEQAARRFINDPGNVRFDESNLTLYLSKIFDWFAVDFLNYLRVKRGLTNPHVGQYVALYLTGSSAQILSNTPAIDLTIKYLDYDKELNEQ